MRFRLTAAIEERIVQYLRAGGFECVAAEAAGIPYEVFLRWIRPDAAPRYRRFALRIMEARAQGRLKAEIDVRSSHPRDWLKYGPGREQPNRPGWTNPARADTARAEAGSTGMDVAQLLEIAATISELLAPYPELRQAVVDTLVKKTNFLF